MTIVEGASDSPITKKKSDELRRGSFVERFARLVTTFSGDEQSNIFALYGEWGSGKTSVWNMLKSEATKKTPKPKIVEFTAWAYSSEDRIFSGFFNEVLAAIDGTPVLDQVSTAFERLGRVLTMGGVIGGTAAGTDPTGHVAAVAVASSAAGKVMTKIGEATKRSSERSLRELHTVVAKALVRANQPILILIDDVDRLPPAQIASLFQLIRVNASLPMVNYLLLMDRMVVERALTELKFPKAYLEKIVQFGVDLPHPAPEDLHAMAISRVMAALTASEQTGLAARMEEAISTAAGVLNTPRAVGRVAESFRFHLEFFRAENVIEVDPIDLFLLEVLRCQAPGLYAFVRDQTGTYIEQEQMLAYFQDKKAEYKAARQAKLDAAVKTESAYAPKALTEIFNSLVPGFAAGVRSNQEDFSLCRLRSAPHFRNYFELTVSQEHPSQAELERVKDACRSQRATNRLVLKLIERYSWDIAISALEAKFKSETEPTILASLITALWVADLARIGAGAPLLSTVGVANLTVDCLRRISDAATREQILKNARKNSRHFGALYRVICSEQHNARESHGYAPIFPVDVLRRLRRECLEEARLLLTSDAALSDPMLIWFLAYQSEAEGPEKVWSWAAELLGRPKQFAVFLKNMVRMHRQDGPEAKLELSRAVLGIFWAIDAKLAHATRDIQGLDSDEADLLQQAHVIAQQAVDTHAETVLNRSAMQLSPFVADVI